MKKKLLIYAHYYVPDVASTGQIIQDMAEGMIDDFDVTVICAVPSYGGIISEDYKGKRFYREEINGVHVLRVSVPEFTKAKKFSRIKNILTYYLNARRATRMVGEQDYVFALSQPPILGGLLGVYGKKKLEAKLVYSIQDFNPEQIEATNYIGIKPIIEIVRKIDIRNCRESDLVITVGRDLVETLRRRFDYGDMPRYAMINNWIDDKEVYPLSADNPGVVTFKKENDLLDKFIFMYSGNMGLYYDLEGLITLTEKFKGAKTPDGREVVFAFVGAGSIKDKLVEYKEEHNLDNVIFIPYQDKDKLIFSLNAADVHWCVNAKGIKGVSCPSKFYGIAAVGKPVLAVLEDGSEVSMLINEIGCGKMSEPGLYDKVEENIRWFINNADGSILQEMGRWGYEYLCNNLTKDISVRKYIDSIKAL